MASQYMNLELPTPLVTITPTWATELITALELIDAHDHTSNKGNQVPSAGININADLDFGSYRITTLMSNKFDSQGASLTGASHACSVYVYNGNLYYTNLSGNAVQITSGGSIASVAGALSTVERTAIAGNLTINAGDTFVLISVDTSAARSITMPSVASVTEGRIYIIKDATGSAHTYPITINPDGSDTIDTESSITMNSPLGALWLFANGSTNWEIA